MTRRLLLHVLTVLALTSAIPAFGEACGELPSKFSRPTCSQDTLQYSLCLNPNLQEAFKTVESPAYKLTFNQVVRQAQAYLEDIAPAPNKVVITDLDETLVSNLGYYKRYQRFAPEHWQSWLRVQTPATYFPAVRQLLLSAKARGFKVMFITGRSAEHATATLHQIPDIPWDGVFFKPGNTGVSSNQYKIQARQMLRNLGYEIVLNIGDQPSDFDQPIDPEAGEFLLPNVIYSIP